MPPKGDPLTPEQIAKLKAWIDQGAKYEEHWAYVKPVQKPLPEIKDKNWPRNGIDRWVLARLEQEGLAPSPEADRATLLRRVSLDLTGLPPTLAGAGRLPRGRIARTPTRRSVDRLLASPAYGEHDGPLLARPGPLRRHQRLREGRPPHRLALPRLGHQRLQPRTCRSTSSPSSRSPATCCRNATLDQKIATGFHRNTMVNTEGGTDDEEFRVAAVVDRVNTTMTVWMGTTQCCTQCHNHKYDPFKQKEFYQLFAFFNSTEDHGRSNAPELPLPTPEQAAQDQDAAGRAAALKKSAAGLAAALGGAGAHAVRLRAAALEKEAADVKPATTLVMQELPQPRPTHIMLRGNFQQPRRGGQAGRAGQAAPAAAGAPANRLGLAKWLVDPNNPLTARVTMNRMWAQHFGKGIVETSEDFGTQGEPPTPSGIARLAGRGVYEPQMGHKGDAQADRHVGDLPAGVEGAGGPG